MSAIGSGATGAAGADRLLTLAELCDWLNITERHARKLVERDAIPYRKVGHLLRFSRREVETWTRPVPRPAAERNYRIERDCRPGNDNSSHRTATRRSAGSTRLPKSLLD